MMCSCEEEFGLRFLPHQLSEATELRTQRRIPVTLGFQRNVCNVCRGLPEEANPVAEIYGRSSKVQRYYWREIFFETTRRFADWAEYRGCDYDTAHAEHQDVYESIEKTVITEFKVLHQENPNYFYNEESQSEVLEKYQVKVTNLPGRYVQQQERKARVFHKGKAVTVEEYVTSHYESQGYEVLSTESIPFHVLFGVFMWLLVQDPSDQAVRIVGFGERQAYEEGRIGQQIWSPLPDDFGTVGYAQRRESEIEKHFASFPKEKEDLLWLFNYWIGPSEGLRQYLWAHRHQDVQKARRILSILPVDVVLRILRHLIGNYWGRYLGWPDLLVHKGSEFLFVEVKSSKDKLSEDQKGWVRENAAELHLPFELVKIHRQNTGQEGS